MPRILSVKLKEFEAYYKDGSSQWLGYFNPGSFKTFTINSNMYLKEHIGLESFKSELCNT